RLAVDLGIEARIGIGVGHVDDALSAEGLAGDAAVGAEANDVLAGGDATVQLVVLPVVEKDGGAFAVEYAQGGLLDGLQQRPQLAVGAELTGQLEEGVQVGKLLGVARDRSGAAGRGTQVGHDCMSRRSRIGLSVRQYPTRTRSSRGWFPRLAARRAR